MTSSCILTTTTYCLTIVMLLTPGVTAQREPTTHAGTTKNIKEVFIGRCWDYKITKYKDLLPRVYVDCESLWQKFFAGFSYRPPCAVDSKGYQDFIDAASQRLPENKVMFWSGVYYTAHRYSDAARLYVTLEDTMMGYLANSLIWCGQSIDPGMNYTRCPEWKDCPSEASMSFWTAASVKFAQGAAGENVTLMLGGSNPNKPAYRRDSVFGQYELPNLNESIKVVNVILTHDLEKPKIETCTTGSLVALKQDVEAAGRTFRCKSDPIPLLYLLCSEDPTARECQMMQSHAKGLLPYPSEKTDRLVNTKPVDRMNSCC